MKSYPSPAIRLSSDTTCACATFPPSDSGRKRQRQWSEQKVSVCPPGQTFTPRLLIIISLTPSPLTLLSAAPRSFAEPLDQSRKTSTPTNSFCGAFAPAPATADKVSPDFRYFLGFRICGVCPNR